jgi:hypothetical protein
MYTTPIKQTTFSLPVSEEDKDDIHNKRKLKKLLRKAEDFVSGNTEMCHYFYRDKKESYFDDLRKYEKGSMVVYRKDHRGDPKSPINGRMDGLFFSTNVGYGTDQPVPWSIYGDTRLKIPMERLYKKCPNLWFTDFYCIHAPHIATLVMTRPGSASDKFCRRYLIPLSWENNCFLQREDVSEDDSDDSSDTRSDESIFRVTTSGLWVEVFFTENINIKQYLKSLEDVTMKGRRSGGTTGLTKNAYCSTCNV